jgi:hypothetical protein
LTSGILNSTENLKFVSTLQVLAGAFSWCCRYRIGGTITLVARQASLSASAAQARGVKSRLKHTCTSRSRGAPCLLQVATTESGGRRGLVCKKAAAIAEGDCSIAPLGLVNGVGITTDSYARRSSAKKSAGSNPLQVPCADHSW